MFRTTSIGLAFVAAALLTLAGCGQPIPPAMKPLSKQARALLAEKGMREDAPIFIRIFKEESELEVWKQRDDGQYALFKSYAVCKWSGDLGPKQKEGDRQAPEGFYQVSAGQMNPNSSYHLSFNLGYPNRYDKAFNRTGKHLMVHGDCKSAGCYAMTDAQIEEIYILAREAFKGGQEVFHVHAFPFRMTDANMELHRGNRWYGFWSNLKEGYDYFEKVRRPPEVQVCERRYLVNASFINASARVDPRGACPPYRVLPTDLFPQPAYTQEAKARRSNPSSTGSVSAAASQVPSFRQSPARWPAPKQSVAQSAAPAQPGAASQASLLASQAAAAQPAQPEQQAETAPKANGQWTTQTQGAPAFSQYAPSSSSGSSFQFNATSGR